MSLASSAASELAAAPASLAASSFSHQEATRMQLHNEAFSLPEALLDHLMEAKLVTKEGEALPPQLSASTFQKLVPKLDKEKLTFWLVLHQEAFQSFKDSGFDQLPQQRCPGTENANLGNWQASSSFAKQASFFGWIVNRYPKLAEQESFMCSLTVEPQRFGASARFMQLHKTVSLDFRASDVQLVFWGKLDKRAFQPSFKELGVEVGEFAWKLPSFKVLQQKLYLTASFDWGTTSSAWQLSSNWKRDIFQHTAVYEKLAEELGEASPLAKLIKKQLEGSLAARGAACSFSFSSFNSFLSFWKNQAQKLAANFQETLAEVAALEGAASAGSLDAAWPGQLSQEAWAEPSQSKEPSGRIDGSDLSLASGLGNLPLDKKLLFAEEIGSLRL